MMEKLGQVGIASSRRLGYEVGCAHVAHSLLCRLRPTLSSRR